MDEDIKPLTSEQLEAFFSNENSRVTNDAIVVTVNTEKTAEKPFEEIKISQPKTFAEPYIEPQPQIDGSKWTKIDEEAPPQVVEEPQKAPETAEEEPKEAPQEPKTFDHSAVAVAIEPFNNIKIVKVDGKLVIKDLENGLSPCHRFFRAIKRFFVDRKTKQKTQKGA